MISYWNEIYTGRPSYYHDAGDMDYSVIAKLIPKGASVLDCGCGGAVLSQFLPDNPYTGIDSSSVIIARNKQKYPDKNFLNIDMERFREGSRQYDPFRENQFDVVVMRHCLSALQDWQQAIRDMFWVANKKVIIVEHSIGESSILIDKDRECCNWKMGFEDLNMVVRTLSVNVSYGILHDDKRTRDSHIIVIGKHLDKVVFELDDMCPELNPMPTLLELKERFPKLKVTLFCINSKCPDEWVKDLQSKYDWIEWALHGWYHDTEHGRAQEANYWTTEEANEYLDKCEAKGLFKKEFRPPGWGINYETYKVLIDRGYRICEHLAHNRFPELGGERYTTGHLMEVHGHTWECNMNGVKELATTKCNFSPNTEFLFVSEALLGMENYLPNRYQ